jgi:hypothetical protein
VCTGSWFGSVKERDHLKDEGVDGSIMLKWILSRYSGRSWTEVIRLGIGTSSGLL